MSIACVDDPGRTRTAEEMAEPDVYPTEKAAP
jgi:hypothetical protein